MPEKVLDPSKQVTDPVLLSVLAKQGIDWEGIEFFQDYASRSLGKEHSPYAKFYRDLVSGKKFMVVSGLPMVDADGIKIEVGWRVDGINYFSEKNNLFRAKVQDTQVEITIRNDQPDGRKANDRLSYKPQLFLDGIEQIPSAPVLLPVDPANPNYLENTLEWDYGVCKRRLRVIEGSILGSWVFTSKPVSEVRIRYNQVGNYKLRLGQFKVNDDEEIVKPEDFDELARFQGGYPVTVSDSATYYPDAHIESTSVDGFVRRHDVVEAWATIRAGAGTGAFDNQVEVWGISIGMLSSGTVGNWTDLRRTFLLFDTNGLPDNAIKTAATLSLYGSAKADEQNKSPTVNVYSSLPASNTALAAADFATLGSTAFSTAITYANWLIADPFWNDFVLNAAGIAAISLTGVSKFGLREDAYDTTGTDPNSTQNLKWEQFNAYASEKGNGYKPKLVVTYTAVTAWEKSLSDTITITDAIGKTFGVAKADIITLADAISKLAGLGRADTISLTDSLSKTMGLVKADTITVSDLISVVLTTSYIYGMLKLRDGFKVVQRGQTKL